MVDKPVAPSADDGPEPRKEDPAFDAAVAAAQARGRGGDLAGAVEALLALEKGKRNEGDSFATSRACCAIVALCFEMRDLRMLNAQVLVLSKRRGQLKQAITDMVQATLAFVEQLPARADRVELLNTLKTTTGSHIYVEVERARATRMLALIQEGDGRIAEASETLQEVQVETYGSMDKRDKADLILEQMRLCMRQRDFVRMGIIANKISKKVLDEEGFEALKLRYLALMALLAHARHDAMALARGAADVLETRGVAADAAQWRPALASACIYTVLAPWDSEASSLANRLKGDARLAAALPSHAALLTMLTTQEIVAWPLPAQHEAALRAHDAFALDPNAVGAPGGPGGELGAAAAAAAAASRGGAWGPAPTAAMAFDNDAKHALPAAAAALAPSASASASSSSSAASMKLRPAGTLASSIVLKEDEPRAQWWPMLHKRVVQHNVRVLASAYSRCRFPHLARMLGLDAPTTEAVVSELVSSGTIYAKMDRPQGLVVFARPRDAAEVLTAWARDLDEVLLLIDKTTHLVSKEVLTHSAKAKAAALVAAAGAGAS